MSASSARWLVRLHFGSTAIPSRSFASYAQARRYAGTLRRASVRLILSDREQAGLYWLLCVLLLSMLVYGLRAA